MNKVFTKKRIEETVGLGPGNGVISFDIPFIPDFINPIWLTPATSHLADTLDYDLTFTGDPIMPYHIDITWAVRGRKGRRMKYTVARLSELEGTGA